MSGVRRLAEAPQSRPARYGTASLHVFDDGARLRCRIAGEIDLANSGDIFAAISRALTSDHEGLVIDLGETSYIDSAGLALLVEINGRLQTRRTRLVVVAAATSAARRLLAISGVDQVLEVTDPV